MKIALMMNILMTLLNNRKVSRQTLAEKYEISTRSVVRYNEELTAAGIPIYSLRGPYGGYCIPDSFRIDRHYFSEAELKRLLESLTATEKSFGDELNGQVIEKLRNLARNHNDDRYFLKSDKLIIDIGTWTNPRQYHGKMAVISRAIEEDITLFMRYVDSTECESERFFDPYSLVLKEGVWYTYGYCHYREDFRLFRLTRIESLRVTDMKFERLPSDVFAKLKGDFSDKDLVEVSFELNGEIRSEIEEWLGMEAIKENNGLLTANATLFGGRMLINKLLSYGSAIKVLSPLALKEEVMVECARILRNYEQADTFEIGFCGGAVKNGGDRRSRGKPSDNR